MAGLTFCTTPEAVLPSHESRKGLADQFVTFFSDKIAKIRNSFSSSDLFTLPPPPDVPNFSCFKQVSQEETSILTHAFISRHIN